jgi:hypothetical protein
MAARGTVIIDYDNEYNLLGAYTVKRTPIAYLFKKVADIEEYPNVGSHFTIIPLEVNIFAELKVPKKIVSYGRVEKEDEQAYRAEQLVDRLSEELDTSLKEQLEGRDLEILAIVRKEALRGIAPDQLAKYFDNQILKLIDPSSVAPQSYGRKPLSVYNARPPLLRGDYNARPPLLRERKGGRRTRKSKTARKHKRHSRTRTQSKHRK